MTSRLYGGRGIQNYVMIVMRRQRGWGVRVKKDPKVSVVINERPHTTVFYVQILEILTVHYHFYFLGPLLYVSNYITNLLGRKSIIKYNRVFVQI